ncbi:MAG: hypothetical protein ACREBV_10000, partial [Candidatus Zixiibacteriota bacterium]
MGKLILGVSNKGYFGNTTLTAFYNCINAEYYYIGCEFPKKSGISLLGHGSIWIGGVRGGDTLVSEGFMGGYWEVPGFHEHPPWSEFNPEEIPQGEFIQMSSNKLSEHFNDSAVSEQDLIGIYCDTIVTLENLYDFHPGARDFLDLRYHKPLYVEVRQKSHAWSLGYAENIVIFETDVTNIGENSINAFSFGIQIRPGSGYINPATFSYAW